MLFRSLLQSLRVSLILGPKVIRQILAMVKIFENDDITAVKKMRKNKLNLFE